MTLRRSLLPLVLVLLGSGGGLVGADAARDAVLVRSLESRRVRNVSFQAAPLKEVVAWLRVVTGMNIVVKEAALQKAGIDTSALAFDAVLDDVRIRTLLEVLFQPHGIFVKVQDNVVFLTTKAEAAGKPITRLYGIAHITWTKVDFIAPDMNLRPSGYVPDGDYVPEQVVEDDPLSSGEAVAELLKEIVAPGEWGSEGWSIRATDRHLVVRAPRSVHAEIDRALAVIASLK